MKIGIIGATGKAGNKILKEATKRNHDVTAIVRDASKLEQKDIPVIAGDVMDLTTSDVQDFDVVINAFGAPAGKEALHVSVGRHLIDIFSPIDTRLLVVGGAGSLYVDDNQTTKLIDTPDFPKEFVPTAANQGQNLEDLQVSAVNYTFISPSAFFDPKGNRTGNYILGTDKLLVNSDGDSYVSYADFAVALLDEVETPAFKRQRFTVASEKGLPNPL